MTITLIAFMAEDTEAVIAALGITKMPRVFRLSEMSVIPLSRNCFEIGEALQAAGISFNYAQYRDNKSVVPRNSGQVRYGHDGIPVVNNLVPDAQLAYAYEYTLRWSEVTTHEARTRIVSVCCGQDSWDNRKENGEMHKMRLLLT